MLRVVDQKMKRKRREKDIHNQTYNTRTLFITFFLNSSSRGFTFVYQISSDNPQKDNFHNLILGIDKMLTFGMIDSTILKGFLFPKGVVDGERSLRFPL